MNKALKEIIRFQTDRGLHKKDFDLDVASMNILEEVLEAHGVKDNSNRKYTKRLLIKLNEVVADCIIDGTNYEKPTEEDIVDAFCDIQVFASGEVLKIGYCPIISLIECGKEINSRVGTIIDGKFVKDKSNEAMLNWYKADYSKAKIEN